MLLNAQVRLASDLCGDCKWNNPSVSMSVFVPCLGHVKHYTSTRYYGWYLRVFMSQEQCECSTDDGVLCRGDIQCLWEAALFFYLNGWWWWCTLQELVGKQLLPQTVTISILGKSISVCNTGASPLPCLTWMRAKVIPDSTFRESVKRNILNYTHWAATQQGSLQLPSKFTEGMQE